MKFEGHLWEEFPPKRIECWSHCAKEAKKILVALCSNAAQVGIPGERMVNEWEVFPRATWGTCLGYLGLSCILTHYNLFRVYIYIM